MAFRLVSSGGATVNPTIIELESSGSVTIGDAVVWSRDQNGGVRYNIKRSPAALACYKTFGVAANTVNSATGRILIVPINESQLWEADTTAATNVTYIGYCVALAAHNYLDGATHASGTSGVFEILGNVGATTDKKVIGRFVRVPVDDI